MISRIVKDRFATGIALAEHKAATAERPIENLPLPERVFVSMRQHIGIPAEPLVRIGQAVHKGQFIGASPGGVSAPVHAPTSGRIVAVGPHVAAHASGLSVPTVTIEADGRDEWGPLPPPLDPDATPAANLVRRIGDCGVVGMGGAAFPSAAKLELRHRHQLHTLVINGAECEPYLTADDRLMREHAAEIVDGARILQRIVNVPRVRIAIEANKPGALAAMRDAAAAWKDIEIVATPARYPGGAEKQLVYWLTGREAPSQGLPADVGTLVHNVATAFAVREAVRFGRPLITRVVTVSGGAVRSPANLRVPVGAPVGALLGHCGGLRAEPARIVVGGPMMGEHVSDLQAPIVKGANGVLALTRSEISVKPEMPCIRCGDCLGACPVGLEPQALANLIRKERLEAAVEIGLYDCISCGACAWVCPSHLPLVQYFQYAKGRLAEIGGVRAHQAELQRLTKQREERLERLEREKEEARARRAAARVEQTATKAEATPP